MTGYFSTSLKVLSVAAMVASASLAAHAADLSGPVLVQALKQGGYVLVMRHASSPEQVPDRAHANPDNVRLERQLDEAGRNASRAMGDAIRALRLPIGEVLASPTYRAAETVRYAGLGEPTTYPELGDGGLGMLAPAEPQRAAFLKAKAAEAPGPGSDVLIVTHAPNIVTAFGALAAGIADGESLVFHPDGKGGTEMVARVKIGDWPLLARAEGR